MIFYKETSIIGKVNYSNGIILPRMMRNYYLQEAATFAAADPQVLACKYIPWAKWGYELNPAEL